MKGFIRKLLCFAFITLPLFCLGQSSVITIRRAPPEKIQKYLADKAFRYEEDNSDTGTNWWDVLMQWISKFFKHPIVKDQGFTMWDGILILLALAAIGAIIYFVIKGDKVGLFYRGPKSAVPLTDHIEDIHEIDLNALARQAMEQGQYRVAIRYLYLQLLKDLSEKRLIHWRAEKTNWDYSNEMRQSPYSKQFNSVTLLFDYAWYGDIPINENVFTQMKESFEQFNSQLKTTR